MLQCENLPLEAMRAGHDTFTSSSAAAKYRPHVLIVDDSDSIRVNLSLLISMDDDLEVVGESANGQDAVNDARVLRPDVIVMDFQMPLLDGADATLLIRKDNPEAIVIGITVFADKQVRSRMMSAGAVCVLDKGTAAVSLVPAIKRTCVERGLLAGSAHVPNAVYGFAS